MKTKSIGRNELCPCGSGKKYKKCCLDSDERRGNIALPPASRFAQRHQPVNRLWEQSTTSGRWNEVIFDAPLANGGRLHAALLYSDKGIRRTGIRSGEHLTLDLPNIHFRGPATVVAIQRSSAKRGTETEVVRVVQFRDTEDLGKVLYGKWSPSPEAVERWRSRRRELVLRMDFPDDSCCNITLSRSTAWIDEYKVREGEAVFLDLEHVGVRGWANVLEINPHGPVEVDEGELVIGTFKFSHGQVGELVLESEPQPIGVTAFHPFWSVDRKDWVPVSALKAGEQVNTINGPTRVVSFTMTDCVEPVYNLEVAYDHCYRVGQSGVLVHNQSAHNIQAWLNSLERCNKAATGPIAAAFEKRACGTTQYWIVGGAERVCIDAIEGTAAVDCKAIENPESSAQLGNANEFWAEFGPAKDLAQLKKIAAVVSDTCNPLTKIIIAVENDAAVPYWQGLLAQLSVAGEVNVR